MFTTATDLHVAFLDGIRKSYTGTVIPSVFQRIWNEWAQPEWLASNVSSDEGVELTQKQIDDLAVLVNRWLFIGDGSNLFKLPDGVIGIDVDLNGNTTNVILPKYYRHTSIRFSLDYGNNPNQICNLKGISRMLGASYMRSDKRSYSYSSIYRKPSDNLLYWQRTNVNVLSTTTPKIILSSREHIEMLSDELIGSKAYCMYLEYLTFPNEINMSTPLIGSILSTEAKREIIKLCVQTFLERVQDPRYQSFLMEQKIHNSNKS